MHDEDISKYEARKKFIENTHRDIDWIESREGWTGFKKGLYDITTHVKEQNIITIDELKLVDDLMHKAWGVVCKQGC